MHKELAVRADTAMAEAVTAALRALLSAYAGTERLEDPVRLVTVSGNRIVAHLAVRLSGSAELAELEARVVERIRALGASEIDVIIRSPRASPLLGKHELRNPWTDRVQLASVRHVVAVGAGKGGVGKSTVAVNLALALAGDGLRVGLMDADIYGPSLPILLGVEHSATRARMTPEKYIVPLETYGLPLVSFGFFLGERSPAIWRGPTVSKAVKQFARGVAWPELDILLVDLPPGTGDVPLSLAQAIGLSGAVIVTQPTVVAIAEAYKAVRMFKSLEVPILGIIENMIGPFGSGAGRSMSLELEVPFLDALPFDEMIVRDGDTGSPAVVARPHSAISAHFDRIAQQLAEQLGWQRVAPASQETADSIHQ